VKSLHTGVSVTGRSVKKRQILSKYRPKWSLNKQDLLPEDIFWSKFGNFKKKVAKI
jgi:hypothetical protein